jgi:hypothetical protein
MKNNEDSLFWVIVVLGIVGIGGYYAYDKYIKPKLEAINKIKKI